MSNDEELGQGDANNAMAAAFRSHFRLIYRYFARRAGADDATDLAAEVFRRAMENWERYEAGRGEIRPWLFGIAANVWREQIRGFGRMRGALSRLGPGPNPDPFPEAVDRLQAEALGPELARALSILRGSDREVLLLYAWEDLTYEEIAGALGIPIGTVRSRLHRARSQLRELLSGYGQELGEATWRASGACEDPSDG